MDFGRSNKFPRGNAIWGGQTLKYEVFEFPIFDPVRVPSGHWPTLLRTVLEVAVLGSKTIPSFKDRPACIQKPQKHLTQSGSHAVLLCCIDGITTLAHQEEIIIDAGQLLYGIVEGALVGSRVGGPPDGAEITSEESACETIIFSAEAGMEIVHIVQG